MAWTGVSTNSGGFTDMFLIPCAMGSPDIPDVNVGTDPYAPPLEIDPSVWSY